MCLKMLVKSENAYLKKQVLNVIHQSMNCYLFTWKIKGGIYNLFLTLKIKYSIHQYSPGFRILVLLRFWLQEIKLFQVLILKRARNSSWCRNFARNWVLAKNSNFLVPISLHPCGVNLRYFKLWTLLDQKL